MTENNSNRRDLLKTGLGLVAAAGTMITSGKAKADDKLAHELVQYQATPKDGLVCAKCAQWQPPAGCAIVASPIAPPGWCVAYAPKEG
jgi:hypothetical protein